MCTWEQGSRSKFGYADSLTRRALIVSTLRRLLSHIVMLLAERL